MHFRAEMYANDAEFAVCCCTTSLGCSWRSTWASENDWIFRAFLLNSSHIGAKDLSRAYKSIRYVKIRCFVGLPCSRCTSLLFKRCNCILSEHRANSSSIFHLITVVLQVAHFSSQANNFTTATTNRTRLDTYRKKTEWP